MSNFTVPPPFSNLPNSPSLPDCPVCLPCVIWEIKQKVAVATTCGLLAGVMVSAIFVHYFRSPMVKLRKISRGFMLPKIPENAEVGQSHV